jgi:hypothetical protein
MTSLLLRITKITNIEYWKGTSILKMRRTKRRLTFVLLYRRKFIHVLKFMKGKTGVARIGRGSEAEIKVINSTVSRLHASINYKKGKSPSNSISFIILIILIGSSSTFKISLSDIGSKFGTCVLGTLPFELKPGDENYIQVGRSLMNICLIKSLCR